MDLATEKAAGGKPSPVPPTRVGGRCFRAPIASSTRPMPSNWPAPKPTWSGTVRQRSMTSMPWCCRWVRPRRLSPHRGDRSVLAGHGPDRGDGGRRQASPRNLQRVPNPVRSRPTARCIHSQFGPLLHMPLRRGGGRIRQLRPHPGAPIGQVLRLPLNSYEGNYVDPTLTGRVAVRYRTIPMAPRAGPPQFPTSQATSLESCPTPNSPANPSSVPPTG